MKRIYKNILMIICIIVLIGSIIFTMNYAKEHTNNNNANTTNNMNTPPDMPSGGTPPSKPNSDSNSQDRNAPPERPGGDTENSNTPPEKPSNDNNNEDNSVSTDNDSGNVRNDNNSTNNSNNNTPPNMNNNNESISSIYYVIFGIEGLLLSGIVIYLIMSKFNKKNIKETFSSSDKVIIYTLSLILLTSGITYGSGYITNNLLNNSSNDNNSKNMSTNNNTTYTSPNEITESKTITSGEYDSSASDENSILVNGDIDVNISNAKVTKTGDSNGGDNTSFYGTNSAILAKDGATLTLKNITVTTNATGANGVFSYGGSATTNNSNSDGTTINISDSKITTTKDNSGGIMTTGGGIMNASNLEITTSGISSAAIRSDRGGGTVNVDGGTYKTTGQGSPTIYSTANITVKNAKLTSTASEGVVIEGKNSVTLENVELTDTNNKLNGQSTTYKNIFLYQSMSGDAATGNSSFTAKNSTITTNKGDTLYVTNTTSSINLENNKIINNDKTGNFLRIKADSWGNNGSNGGDVTLVMNNQKSTGNIVVDNISTLDITINNNSYYEGTINNENTAKSIKLSLDKTSKIKLTGDSYITSLDDKDTTYSNIDFNGYKLYVGGKSIN